MITGDGGAAPTIVFSHANGFPAGTYRQIFERWRAAGWRVVALEKIGHDPRFPVTNGWPHLRAQLIELVEREAAAAGPSYLVGHSLGGYLSLMAALRRPDLAAGVVMLDSPIVTGWRAGIVALSKLTGLVERYPAARASQRRRREWDSADAVLSHFGSKPAFARWAEGVLADYVASGTEAHAGRRRLAFDREIETAIYRTLPDRIARAMRRHPLRCPLGFVHGTASNEMRQVGLAATARIARAGIVAIDGSHLFPFERPAETAAAVLGLLGRMRRTADAGEDGANL